MTQNKNNTHWNKNQGHVLDLKKMYGTLDGVLDPKKKNAAI